MFTHTRRLQYTLGLVQFILLSSSAMLLGQTVIPMGKDGIHQRVIEGGIQVDFMLEHLDSTKFSPVFKEGEDVRFSFMLSDTASKKPLSGAYPAAWMQLSDDSSAVTQKACKEKIQTFLSGGIFGQAELDLNVYYVLALNEDPTITVVDPLFGYGGSKLLALIQLHSPGKDWILSRDKRRIFVTTPESHEVVVIETSTWKITKFIHLNNAPDRIVLQPDGHYAWVAYQEGPEGLKRNSGVAVINVETLEVAAEISTGAGAHDITIDDDNKYAYVSNYDQGTVSVIDIGSLNKKLDIKTHDGPGFMAWSSGSKSLYVTHLADSSITCITESSLAVYKNIPLDLGTTRIRFAPGGRFGFIVNPDKNYVYILDASTNKIIQRGKVQAGPDQVVFSDELAYIRHRGSETVLMVPLASIGTEGAPIAVVDIPGGDNPPGKTMHPTLADGIVQTPGEGAVVISNPLDKSIYFYKEGMAAPMGSFSNYDRKPLAVMVVDRSLRESKPGTYQTIAKLRRPGKYCLAYFMDAPRFGHCFELEVQGEGDIQLARTIAAEGPLKITPLFTERTERVGQDVLLRFALHPHDKPVPITSLKDVEVLCLTNSGQWNKRQFMTENDKVSGVYETTIRFPKPGPYFVYVSCLSKGLTFNNTQYLIINAVDDVKN